MFANHYRRFALCFFCFFAAAALSANDCIIERGAGEAWLSGRAVFANGRLRFCLGALDPEGGDLNNCYAFYPDSGRYERDAEAGRTPVAPDFSLTRPPAGYRIEIQTRRPRICRDADGRCLELQLQRPVEARSETEEVLPPRILLSDAAILALRYDYLEDRTLIVEAYSRAQGSYIGEYRILLEDPRAALFAMLDGALYVRDCVGAGPGCSGRLLKPQTGELILKLYAADGESLINMYEGSEIRIGTNVWLFVSGDGGTLLWINAASGAVIRRLAFTPVGIDGGAQAVPGRWDEGEILLLYGGARAGEILAIDAGTGALRRRFTPRVCPP